ncbi:MAG: M23 family metallopeptidase [Clostridiales bacterium]|nr:M23 family metallopeptidase [Clostridiales bacterium]
MPQKGSAVFVSVLLLITFISAAAAAFTLAGPPAPPPGRFAEESAGSAGEKAAVEPAISSLRPGEIALLKVVCPQGARLTLENGAGSREIPLVGGRALLNIPVTEKAGMIKLVLCDDSGTLFEETLEIAERAFGSQKLSAGASGLQTPSSEDYALYNAKVAGARAESAGEPLWQEEGFVLPLFGRVTTEFACHRYIGGEFSSRHSGVDIAAPAGTEVVAAARGIVTLAEFLPVTGNTVIIDHGMGLFSLYGHLQSLSAVKGGEVAAGQVIGRVGSTGFSTGPHLHLTFTAHGEMCDPFQLVPRP